MYINLKEFIDTCLRITAIAIVVAWGIIIFGWLLVGGVALHFAEKHLH